MADESLRLLVREELRSALARLHDDSSAQLTVSAFAERWLRDRDTATKDDDRGRLENHVLPVLGNMLLSEVRPRHVRALVDELKTKCRLGNVRKDRTRVASTSPIAPRTVRHVYGTLRAMMRAAVADELIVASPCVLVDELPPKKDKDRSWRRTAVFTREEVCSIIFAPEASIPSDRRVMYSLMFLGAIRFGEAAALRWADYDPTLTPLGRLVIERSYCSKTHRFTFTKTDNPREMPVHASLAAILQEWRERGFANLFGRAPGPDDLIVPSRLGNPRNANHMLRRFHQDLARLGLRARRQHDARRTFISLARADGARADILRFVTHGPSGQIIDDYTTLPWSALCEEVMKLQLQK